MSECILTHRQFQFLQAHHQLIENAVFASAEGDSSALDEFLASEDYQKLFSGIDWNAIYARYQETPGFDINLQMMSRCILTPRQFAFMQAHHELFELAWIDWQRGDRTALDEFMVLDAFYELFGNMCLDDLLDRYEDTPGYDPTLRQQLREQLWKDVKTGRNIMPRTGSLPRRKIHHDPVDPPMQCYRRDMTPSPELLALLKKKFEEFNSE